MNVIHTTSQDLELQSAPTLAKRPVKVLLVEADSALAHTVLGHLAGTLRVQAEVTHATSLARLCVPAAEQFHTILLDLDCTTALRPKSARRYGNTVARR